MWCTAGERAVVAGVCRLLRRCVKALSRSALVERKKEEVIEYAEETMKDNSRSDLSSSFFIRANATLSLPVIF